MLLAVAAVAAVALIIVMLDEPPSIGTTFPGATSGKDNVIVDPVPDQSASEIVEQMPTFSFVHGSNLESIPTNNRTLDDVFVTSKNHNSAWAKEKRHHWKEMGKSAEIGKDYGAYVADKDNIDRMKKGKAPIGWDGKSVELHHTSGIKNNFYDYIEVTRTEHILIHHGK